MYARDDDTWSTSSTVCLSEPEERRDTTLDVCDHDTLLDENTLEPTKPLVEYRQKLRRTLALIPRNIDQEMSCCYYSKTCDSNKDIMITTSSLSRGKFKHPRAKQMAAAARYGWVFTPEQAQHPEDWLNRVSYVVQNLPLV